MQTEFTPPTHEQQTPAPASLAAIEDRVRRMETLLHGAESILASIRLDMELAYTPADGEHRASHRRACDLIEFLGQQLTHWRSDEADLDFAADYLGELVRQGIK